MKVPPNKFILDACCGSRMFWFDRKQANTIYMDIRETNETLCDGRKLVVNPDVMGDFRNMPFEDDSFRMVVFDPPHLKNAGDTAWIVKKYGKLNPDTWKNDLRIGFSECFRVLIPGGFLVFKWNEEQISISDVLECVPCLPLFGQKRERTYWLIYMKPVENDNILSLKNKFDNITQYEPDLFPEELFT